MELGKRLIKIRKDNKLTQDEFAKKYFVTRQTISNWENEKSYPDLETLVKISNDFNISLDILLKEDNRMIKDISKKQNNYKFISIITILLNITALIVLLYFAIPYICHTDSINSYSYRTCGFIVLLGLIPTLIINTLGCIFIECNKKIYKFIIYIPSLICITISCLYLTSSVIKETEQEIDQITTFRCYSNDTDKYYFYNVIKDSDKLIVKKKDKKDKISLDAIDTTSIEQIDKSLQEYYKNHNGFCL